MIQESLYLGILKQKQMSNLSEIFAFGSPKGLIENDSSQYLMKKIIRDGNYIHSCLDYGGNLQKISELATQEDLKINLISKIYLEFPIYSSVRRDTLINQITKIKKLFPNNNLELVPQISSIWSIPKYGYLNFISEVYERFFIKRIIIEIFPENEYVALCFARNINDAISKLKLHNKISLGFTSYENKDTSGFNTNIKKFINFNKLEICPMRVLGKINSKSDLKLALNYFSQFVCYEKFFRGITRVSSEKHYEDLINEFNCLKYIQKKESLPEKLNLNNYNKRKIAKNPYGLNKSKIKNQIYVLKAFLKNVLLKPNLKNIFFLLKKKSKKGF